MKDVMERDAEEEEIGCDRRTEDVKKEKMKRSRRRKEGRARRIGNKVKRIESEEGFKVDMGGF